jgi:hypothetical protein
MTFSEPMDPSSFNSSALRAYRFDGGDVAGTISYDADTRVMSFLPASPLAAATKYVAWLTSAKDATGVQLEESVTIIFTTR